MTLEKVEPVDSQATIPSEIEVKVPVEGKEETIWSSYFKLFYCKILCKFDIWWLGYVTDTNQQ